MLSPGRTTDASAEDILMAPDVACSIPNGKKIKLAMTEGPFLRNSIACRRLVVLIAIKERGVPSMVV